MKRKGKYIVLAAIVFILSSCNTLEKASMHGFQSGYYKLKTDQPTVQNVYADVTEENIDVYTVTEKQPGKEVSLSIPLKSPDSMANGRMVFNKKSLDIDITTVLLKYRPSVYGLPAQLNIDFNVALYGGWRHDSYILSKKKDPLGKSNYKISNRGYDFGIFAGPGTTLVSPFTTQNKRTYEYNGMIFQLGIAGFLESNIASFGIALGLDYLLNPDKEVWIYENKPWVGFIIGIALN